MINSARDHSTLTSKTSKRPEAAREVEGDGRNIYSLINIRDFNDIAQSPFPLMVGSRVH